MAAMVTYIVGSYIADKQQYEYNPLLLFPVSTEHLHCW